jgi:hypothetical protein
MSSTHRDLEFDHPLRSCGRPILGSPMLNQIGSDKWKLKITSAGAVEVKTSLPPDQPKDMRCNRSATASSASFSIA